MKKIVSQKYSPLTQYLISIIPVLLISWICFAFSTYIDYRITALLLLTTVSLVAVVFDILPVLLSSILSGLLLNFFFLKPLFTFHISSAEDILLFSIYLIIALVSSILTFKIKQIEKKARAEEEKENTIKLYNTLLNSLSHELRTPVSTIIGAVDTLQQNDDKLSQKNKSILLNEIDHASMRLNQQIENLLNMSRLETGMLKIKQDWCDVNELIFTLIKKVNATESKHVIVFVANEKLPLFKLDSGLLEEVLKNLVTNAFLYTPEGSVITIEATQEGNFCCLRVSDNGPGFPKQEISNAFEKFYRLPHTKTGGSGLGLSIVKGFVEAHQGTISLENNVTGGAQFTISIPTDTSYLKNLKNE